MQAIWAQARTKTCHRRISCRYGDINEESVQRGKERATTTPMKALNEKCSSPKNETLFCKHNDLSHFEQVPTQRCRISGRGHFRKQSGQEDLLPGPDGICGENTILATNILSFLCR